MIKCIFVVAAAVCSIITTTAQSTDSLQNATITASRILQRNQDLTKLTTVVTRQQLEQQSGKSVAQILNEQSGITISGSNNTLGTNQGVYMRGANIGRTLILIDGIPVFDPSFINNEFDLNLISLNDIERIEIVKGAQSALYGSDAIAGVINFITTRYNYKNPINLKLNTEAGSFYTRRQTAQIFGKVEKLYYNIRGGYIQTRGVSAAYDQSKSNSFEKDGFKGFYGQLNLKYALNAFWSASSFLQTSHTRAELDNAPFIDEEDHINKNKTLRAGLGLQYSKEKWSFLANYQYSQNGRRYLNDSSDVPGFAKYVQDEYFGKSQFAESYIVFTPNKQWRILGGLDYRYQSMNNQFMSVSAFGPYATAFKDTFVNQKSLFMTAFFTKASVGLETGIRVNHHSRYGSNVTFNINPSWRLSQQVKIFGAVSTGYKVPSLYQLYGSFGQKHLKPEKAINTELGLQLHTNKMTGSWAAFYRNVNTGIDFDNNGFAYFNVPNQRGLGLEQQLNWRIHSAWSLASNYTMLAMRETMQSRISFEDTTYHYALRRPAHQGNITLSYQPSTKWSTSVSGRFAGRRFDANGYQSADIRLEAYWLVGLFASYDANAHLRLFADLQNVTNRTYFDILGYAGRPFQATLGLRLQW